ncbi:MAG: hypothetical protein P8Z74_10630 [Acidobacteriota bacterium]
MSNRTPHHLEVRMARAMADVRRLARARGLERTYAAELFGLEHVVQTAIEAQSRGMAEHAIEAIRLFAHQLLPSTAEQPAAAATRRHAPG